MNLSEERDDRMERRVEGIRESRGRETGKGFLVESEGSFLRDPCRPPPSGLQTGSRTDRSSYRLPGPRTGRRPSRAKIIWNSWRAGFVHCHAANYRTKNRAQLCNLQTQERNHAPSSARPSIYYAWRARRRIPSIDSRSFSPRYSTPFFFHRNLVDEYLFRFLKRAVAANNATRQFYFIENNCCEVNFVYPDSNRSSS